MKNNATTNKELLNETSNHNSKQGHANWDDLDVTPTPPAGGLHATGDLYNVPVSNNPPGMGNPLIILAVSAVICAIAVPYVIYTKTKAKEAHFVNQARTCEDAQALKKSESLQLRCKEYFRWKSNKEGSPS